MHIRWNAVFTGFLVEFVFSLLVLSFARPEYATSPDLTSSDGVIVALILVCVGAGGYIAGRMAKQDRVLNGLMVGVIDTLFSTLFGSLPRILVIATALGWITAALGGYLSRFPKTSEPPDSSTERGSK
jgi:putative membrane protein (TIGR04086 family)